MARSKIYLNFGVLGDEIECEVDHVAFKRNAVFLFEVDKIVARLPGEGLVTVTNAIMDYPKSADVVYGALTERYESQ